MRTFTKACFGVLAVGAVLTGVGYACGGRQLHATEIPGFGWVERSVERFDDGAWDADWDADWGYRHEFHWGGAAPHAYEHHWDTDGQDRD